MRLQRFIPQFIALSLAILTLVATTPVSAAEIAAPANIGSVSAVGSVQLRGVGISEGTLFSGDRLNVAPGGYAKVVLGSGPKVEVGERSDVTVSKGTDAINIQMTSGNIAFSGNGQKPVRVRIGAFEVTAAGQSRGNVAFVGSGAFHVRVLDGAVSVRNSSTKQSFSVGKGHERLFSLGDPSQSGVLLASASPTAIPAAPAMPRRQMSGRAKTALIVTAVLGSAAAIAVLMTKNDDTDSEAANRLKKAQLLSNVAAVSATAAETSSTAAAVSSATTSALAIINANATINLPANAAAKLALQNRASATVSKANTASNTAISLQAQINQLEAQIEASGTITQAQQTQLDSLLAQLEVARKNANDALNELDKLIADANSLAGGTIIQDPNLDPVDSPNVASPSNP